MSGVLRLRARRRNCHVRRRRSGRSPRRARAAPERAADSARRAGCAAGPPPEDYVVEVGRLFDAVRADYRRHVDVHVSRRTDRRDRGARRAADAGAKSSTRATRRSCRASSTCTRTNRRSRARGSGACGSRMASLPCARSRPDVAEAVERGEVLGERPSARAAAHRFTGCGRVGADAVVERFDARARPQLSGHRRRLRPSARDSSARGIRRRGRVRHRERSHRARGALRARAVARPLSYQDALATSSLPRPCCLRSRRIACGLQGWADQLARGAHAIAIRPIPRCLRPPSERLGEAPGRPAPHLPRLQQTSLGLVRAGGRVAIGSDAPAVPYGLGVHYDLGLIAAAGLPNDQVAEARDGGRRAGARPRAPDRDAGGRQNRRLHRNRRRSARAVVRHATDHGRRQRRCLDRSRGLAREPLTLSDRFTSAVGRGSTHAFDRRKNAQVVKTVTYTSLL